MTPDQTPTPTEDPDPIPDAGIADAVIADAVIAALQPWGWNDRVAALVAAQPNMGDHAEPARVVRVDNTHLYVQTARAARQVPFAALPHEWRDHPSDRPTTGDWLLVDATAEPPTIRAVLPRWSLLARADALGRTEQLLAADVDLVVIVHGLDRPLKPGRIERALALAWDAGASPIIVLTKADLDGAEAEADRAQQELAMLAPDVEVIVTSSVTGLGVNRLRSSISPGRTAVLVGESGAGKSSLVNALLRHEVQETAAVRGGDAKGRHTTTTRDLYPLPDGGVIIDTPGLRAMGLWEANEGVARVFADLEDLADQCRFPNCEHRTEPGCAVLGAVERGAVDPRRVERWLRYIEELEEVERQRQERKRHRKRRRRR